MLGGRNIFAIKAPSPWRFPAKERSQDPYQQEHDDLFEAIRKLMAPPPPGPPKQIGFHIKEDAVPYRAKRKRARF